MEMMKAINGSCESEQSNINEIVKAVDQLNTVIQQGAAAAEQLASMAEDLSSQSEQINSKMSFFDTGSSEILKLT